MKAVQLEVDFKRSRDGRRQNAPGLDGEPLYLCAQAGEQVVAHPSMGKVPGSAEDRQQIEGAVAGQAALQQGVADPIANQRVQLERFAFLQCFDVLIQTDTQTLLDHEPGRVEKVRSQPLKGDLLQFGRLFRSQLEWASEEGFGFTA